MQKGRTDMVTFLALNNNNKKVPNCERKFKIITYLKSFVIYQFWIYNIISKISYIISDITLLSGYTTTQHKFLKFSYIFSSWKTL